MWLAGFNDYSRPRRRLQFSSLQQLAELDHLTSNGMISCMHVAYATALLSLALHAIAANTERSASILHTTLVAATVAGWTNWQVALSNKQNSGNNSPMLSCYNSSQSGVNCNGSALDYVRLNTVLSVGCAAAALHYKLHGAI